MDKTQIDKLICYILAIQNYAKDIHYNCFGPSFYGQHLLADRIQDELYDFIDAIKEDILLAHNLRPLPSSFYLTEAASIIPSEISFFNMRKLLAETLDLIGELTDLSQGDGDLIGNIAKRLQNSLGLLNIMLKGTEND